MALDVRYGEIRSEVIAKLETQKGEMENLLDKLSNTVETLPCNGRTGIAGIYG